MANGLSRSLHPCPPHPSQTFSQEHMSASYFVLPLDMSRPSCAHFRDSYTHVRDLGTLPPTGAPSKFHGQTVTSNFEPLKVTAVETCPEVPPPCGMGPWAINLKSLAHRYFPHFLPLGHMVTCGTCGVDGAWALGSQRCSCR